MERSLVVYRDFFTWFDIPQCYEQNMVIVDFQECIWFARMINVMRPVTKSAAV